MGHALLHGHSDNGSLRTLRRRIQNWRLGNQDNQDNRITRVTAQVVSVITAACKTKHCVSTISRCCLLILSSVQSFCLLTRLLLRHPSQYHAPSLTTPAKLLFHTYQLCGCAGGKMPSDVTDALREAQLAHDAAIAALHAQQLAAIQPLPEVASQDHSSPSVSPGREVDQLKSQPVGESASSGPQVHPGACIAALKVRRDDALLPDNSSSKGSCQQSAITDAAMQPDSAKRGGSEPVAEEQSVTPGNAQMGTATAMQSNSSKRHGSKLLAEDQQQPVMEGGAQQGTAAKMDALYEQRVQRIKESAAVIPEEAEVLVTDLIDHRQAAHCNLCLAFHRCSTSCSAPCPFGLVSCSKWTK